jgi:hypothetical protein
VTHVLLDSSGLNWNRGRRFSRLYRLGQTTTATGGRRRRWRSIVFFFNDLWL